MKEYLDSDELHYWLQKFKENIINLGFNIKNYFKYLNT